MQSSAGSASGDTIFLLMSFWTLPLQACLLSVNGTAYEICIVCFKRSRPKGFRAAGALPLYIHSASAIPTPGAI
jgi:hypothetical protein